VVLVLLILRLVIFLHYQSCLLTMLELSFPEHSQICSPWKPFHFDFGLWCQNTHRTVWEYSGQPFIEKRTHFFVHFTWVIMHQLCPIYTLHKFITVINYFWLQFASSLFSFCFHNRCCLEGWNSYTSHFSTYLYQDLALTHVASLFFKICTLAFFILFPQ
jgi:hypothetical protein